MFSEDTETKTKIIQCDAFWTLSVVVPGASDVCEGAGQQGCWEAPNLGLRPGPSPERRAVLVTEQRATGVE